MWLLDFGLNWSLIHGIRLICGFCSSGQGFASGFLQTPPHNGRPCLWLCASHHRARSGLSPVRFRPCRAHNYKGGSAKQGLPYGIIGLIIQAKKKVPPTLFTSRRLLQRPCEGLTVYRQRLLYRYYTSINVSCQARQPHSFTE